MVFFFSLKVSLSIFFLQAIERLQEKRMELERYVARLQEEERSLRDAIGHSTFLHRQIEFLTERFESLEHEVNLTKVRNMFICRSISHDEL